MTSTLFEASPSDTSVRNWVAVAARAHAILTQSLPDDALDEITAGLADRTPLRLPAMLAG